MLECDITDISEGIHVDFVKSSVTATLKLLILNMSLIFIMVVMA